MRAPRRLASLLVLSLLIVWLLPTQSLAFHTNRHKFWCDVDPKSIYCKNYPWLKQGDQDQEVADVQWRLYRLGYFPSAKFTHYFGEMTNRAVRDFQEDYGLYVDGIVGARDYRVLHEATEWPNRRTDHVAQRGDRHRPGRPRPAGRSKGA